MHYLLYSYSHFLTKLKYYETKHRHERIQMNRSLLLKEHCAISIMEFSEKPRYEEAQDIY